MIYIGLVWLRISRLVSITFEYGFSYLLIRVWYMLSLSRAAALNAITLLLA